MYSSSFQSSLGTGYRRTATNGSSGMAANQASRLTTSNNRASFQGSSATNTYKDKTGTTLAHAARNGVMGTSSTFKNTATNMRTSGGSSYSYGSSAMQRGQSRGKPGSRPTYDSSAAAATHSSYGGAQSSGRTHDEESKAARTRASAEASIYVRQHQRSTNTFGDFTGSIRTFQKPEEDQISSRKHLNQREEELKDMGGIPSFHKERSQNTGLPSQSSQINAGAATLELQRRASQANELSLSRSGSNFTPVGLRNIGNTCFMNSILQPLMASPYLTDYFIKTFPKEGHNRSTRLAQTYAELLQACRNSGGSPVTPSALKNAVARTVATFSGYNQQDSQEFMRFLIDRMHDELNRVTSKPKYRELNFPNMPIEQQSEEYHRYYKARDDSIMSDLFEGQLINRTSCLSCGFQDLAFDNFMDLSVEIPRKAVRYLGSIKLAECMEKYIEPERMIQTGFKCSSCKRKVDIEKDLTIYRFPKILVIHLKRFYHSAMRREKLNTTVNFPETLDMTPYAPHSQHSSKRQAATYQLYGITHHSGSLYGGHYISEVYSFSDRRWYECNDSHVSRASSPDNSSSSAYVLFYVMAN